MSPDRYMRDTHTKYPKKHQPETVRNYGCYSTKNRPIVLAMSQSGTSGMTSRAARLQNSQYSLNNNSKTSINNQSGTNISNNTSVEKHPPTL